MKKKAIILIHGLFMQPFVMGYMANQFRKAKYQVYNFGHKSTEYSEQTLKDLHNLITDIPSEDITIVGHSMGGIVARNYIDEFGNDKNQKVKKIITIGSPINGTITGDIIHNTLLGKILGSSVDSGILTGDSGKPWSEDVDMGCIAGVEGFGINNIIGIFNKEIQSNTNKSDGLIFVDEAIHKDAKDSIVIESSHTGLIINQEVIKQSIFFIEKGKFKK